MQRVRQSPTKVCLMIMMEGKWVDLGELAASQKVLALSGTSPRMAHSSQATFPAGMSSISNVVRFSPTSERLSVFKADYGIWLEDLMLKAEPGSMLTYGFER